LHSGFNVDDRSDAGVHHDRCEREHRLEWRHREPSRAGLGFVAVVAPEKDALGGGQGGS
jgi:hypothetical protein